MTPIPPSPPVAGTLPELPVYAYINHKACMEASLDNWATPGTLFSEPLVKLSHALAALSAHEAEVGRLTQELNVASVGEFGAQSANRHLSALVDFERQVSERCMAVMKALMDSAEPLNNEHQDCFINYADYAKFVDAHAELLYVIKNGERPAALTQGETK